MLGGRKDIGAQLMTPSVIFLSVCLLLIYGAILLLGERADALSQRRETAQITGALEYRIGSTAGRAADAMHLTAFDQIPLKTSRPHGRLYLLDTRGQILSRRLGPEVTPWSPAALNSLIGPAVADLYHSPAPAPGDSPSGHSFAWIGGRPQLATVTYALAPKGALAVDIADLGDIVASSASRLGLDDLRLVRLSTAGAGKASIAPLQLLDNNNQPLIEDFDVGADWTREAVGGRLVAQVMPALLVVTLLVAMVGFWLIQRAQKLARSLVASETQAKHLALHDPMTGLANRLLFTDRLEHALEQNRRTGCATAVACIDLDRFKKVNDTLGHLAGDSLLKEAARRITAVCRASDTVARLGGDEFALVLSPVDGEAGAAAICERLVAALTGVLALDEGKAELSGSLGVTLVTDRWISGEDALRQADLALYRAKADGRGRYAFFEPGMDESLRLRRLVENDLRDALDADQLTVLYQPQFTAKGRMEGVEALVRWTHPTRGVIAPSQFIPIAEEAGLIVQLGDFVLRRALADAARWPAIKIAINVSPLQLRERDFADRCRAMAAKAGVEPTRVELEITEGVLMDNDEQVQATLGQLRESGFTLALDDFGTGYSSLSYLNAYPVDKIKIDRSFVSNLTLDGETDKLVNAIIHLGRVLGLSVTAEGVETEAQRVKLVAAGCNSLQGYLHGRPAEASAIDAMVGGGDGATKAA